MIYFVTDLSGQLKQNSGTFISGELATKWEEPSKNLQFNVLKMLDEWKYQPALGLN